jgi:hypothetical protein
MSLGGRYARLFTLQAAAYTGAPVEEEEDDETGDKVPAGVED